jgi:hypothetical protein
MAKRTKVNFRFKKKKYNKLLTKLNIIRHIGEDNVNHILKSDSELKHLKAIVSFENDYSYLIEEEMKEK